MVNWPGNNENTFGSSSSAHSCSIPYRRRLLLHTSGRRWSNVKHRLSSTLISSNSIEVQACSNSTAISRVEVGINGAPPIKNCPFSRCRCPVSRSNKSPKIWLFRSCNTTHSPGRTEKLKSHTLPPVTWLAWKTACWATNGLSLGSA